MLNLPNELTLLNLPNYFLRQCSGRFDIAVMLLLVMMNFILRKKTQRQLCFRIQSICDGRVESIQVISMNDFSS